MSGGQSDLAGMLRKAEPLLAGGLAAALGWAGAERWGPAGLILLLLAVLAAGWCIASLTGRALAGRGRDGPGVVTLEEGRIGYFGPERGGIVALDDLVAVDRAEDGARWILRDREGQALSIPSDALGAAKLPGALTALPGFDQIRALSARSGPGGQVRVWRREGGPVPPAPRQLH